MAVAACGGSSGSSSAGGSGQASGTAGLKAPEANAAVPSAVGKGEGHLNLIAWEGYAQPQWVKPFEASTGCQVSTKYAGSSSEMVSLMANGGGGQYDLVSASGDADLRLIYGGDVRPINISLIPVVEGLPSRSCRRRRSTRSAASTTASPTSSVPTCCCTRPRRSRRRRTRGPSSTTSSTPVRSRCRTTRSRSPTPRCTCPRRQPELGITDPYELTQPQFNATVALLKSEHPLIKKYWDLASQEISLFQSGTTVVGRGLAVSDQHAQGGRARRSPTRSPARARPGGPTRGCWPPGPRIPTAPTSGCSG